MNFLIANTDSDEYKVLSSEEDILEDFNPSNYQLVEYLSDYKLDEDEMFTLSDFKENSFFIPVCDDGFSTTSLNSIENSIYSDISYLCIIQSDKRYFQRLTPSLYVNKKTVLDYSGDPKIVEHKKQIIINDYSDAIYSVENDTLYFRKLSKIKKIFPGIEMLYREATQEEVDTFLENEFIELDSYEPESVGTYNRKRIADIGAKFNELDDDKKAGLIEYAKEKAKVEMIDGKFKIDSEKSLKNLLYALDERYYRAKAYGEDRVANSVRVVGN